MEAIYVLSTRQQISEGKCWLMNGDLYYSPNSTNPPVLPETTEAVVFTHHVSKSEHFQDPRWWQPATEWLGFVPKQPVNYSGVWFDSLSHIPRAPTQTERGSYSLFGPLCAVWLNAEEILTDIVEILRSKTKLDFIGPFPPRRWKYHDDHPTAAIAQYHIEQGRDWFALWFGLVFWMMRAIPEDDDFVEGVMPPNWFKYIIANHTKHAAMDAIRLSPLLQRMWNVPRVGVWLHHPNDHRSQPSAQWFVEQGVPVWYRWGPRETASADYRRSDFALIRPSAHDLQLATTHITRPVKPSYFSNFSVPDSPASPRFDYFDDSSAPSHFESSDNYPEPPTAVITPPKPKQSADLAAPFWKTHFQKTHERRERQLRNEDPKKKQARLSREKNPPTVSAAVYEWMWNDKDEFVREGVLKSERMYTLGQYGARQKRYDSILNQWDCCEYWGPNREDDDDDIIEVLPFGEQEPIPSIYKPQPLPVVPLAATSGASPAPAQPRPSVLPPPPPPPSPPPPDHPGPPTHPDSSTAPSCLPPPPDTGIKEHVLDILIHHYGFVPPTPLPSSSSSSSSPPNPDAQFIINTLGFEKKYASDPFLSSSLGQLCTSFIRSFISGRKPTDDLWDLSQQNRRTLYFTQRLNSIRSLTRMVAIPSSVNGPPTERKEVFYMFDLGSNATVNWHLTVLSAADAMYVCRLPGDWSEEELASDLFDKGIPFRTFQRRDTLGPAPSEKPVPISVPMRLSDHVFSARDVEFYKRQCESCFVQRRFRAALLRGGIIRRIAVEYLGVGDAISGPLGIHQYPGYMISVRDWNGVEYVDDNMMDQELDVLCGLYLTFTGQSTSVAKKSWFPLTWVFENSGDNLGRWAPGNENAWRHRNDMIARDPQKNTPITARMWRHKLRTAKDHRHLKKNLENWSKEVIEDHVGQV